MLDLAQTFKPHAWLNIHSGMEAMFTPWDHQDKVRIYQRIGGVTILYLACLMCVCFTSQVQQHFLCTSKHSLQCRGVRCAR